MIDYNKYKDISEQCVNEACIEAIYSGNLELMTYLFNSKDLAHNADIHWQEDKIICDACEFGFLDVVQFLLTSPDLKEHSDISAVNYYAFRMSAINNHIEILNFLIYEYDIQIPENLIENYSINPKIQFAFKLIENRELKKSLEDNLDIKPTIQRKVKV